MNLMSWYRSGVLSNIYQGFCPTLAMACEAFTSLILYINPGAFCILLSS
ncbi:MAG: hypothetical protein QOF41_1139, partial [Methylobacteriaceae bacterium]|nr:hypothetical protein [Methylobacteriaceae bacterium]